MTLTTIATGSDGNSFILTNNAGHHLMIEAGLPMGELKKGINFDVASGRLICANNGHFEQFKSSAVCYAWFEWQKGFKGDPIIKWIN